MTRKRNNLFLLLAGLAVACSFPGYSHCEGKGVFSYDEQGKRNPFWPLVDAGGSIINYDNDFMITDMHLEGIVQGKSGINIAIINGQIVKENDIVGKYKVFKISPDSVVLTKDGNNFELKLNKEE
ncbi:MAG: hypothetical protein HQL27_05230 [Candidatus Omnitrophica bacterium]|nr:hypothetical protein [Candidatus Omnitrophota bacterium]